MRKNSVNRKIVEISARAEPRSWLEPSDKYKLSHYSASSLLICFAFPQVICKLFLLIECNQHDGRECNNNSYPPR